MGANYAGHQDFVPRQYRRTSPVGMVWYML